ncbi:MAG TPA: hypothetical protein VHP99_16830 [Pyrinomonadaceae bacterium]|nr:hypothetical protein [Pyrinomonadaceae bacterium]
MDPGSTTQDHRNSGTMTDDIKSTPLARFVTDLETAHADNLSSVTLYGSGARDDANAAARYDVLIVLQRLQFDDLRRAVEPIRNWTSSGQPMPVYFSRDELQRAADVFPVEFLQMEQARKILFGSDPFEFVEISQANLRHQTEYELRTKCLQLRRLYFSSAASPDQLTRLMTDSLSSFAALFRAVLILHGAAPPLSKRDAIRATARVLGLDIAPFNQLLELSEQKKTRLTKSDTESLFGNYLNEIQKVIDEVDQIERKS